MLATTSHLRKLTLTSPVVVSAAAVRACPHSARFVRTVAQRCGVPADERLATTVITILGALARRLRAVDARAVAGQLPAVLAAAFDAHHSHDLHDDAALAAALLAGHPQRQVRAVCQLLAESLDEQARAHLRIQPIAALFHVAA